MWESIKTFGRECTATIMFLIFFGVIGYWALVVNVFGIIAFPITVCLMIIVWLAFSIKEIYKYFLKRRNV